MLEYRSTPRKIAEERRARIRHGVGSLKYRKIQAYFLNYIELFMKNLRELRRIRIYTVHIYCTGRSTYSIVGF